MTASPLTATAGAPSRVRPAAASPTTKPARRGCRRAGAFYLFVAPWLVGLIGLTVFPLGYALWLSMTNSDGLSPNARFVGLRNYRELLSDPQTLQVLARTGLFTAVTVPATIVGGLFLALLVNRPIPGRAVFRTLLYLPAVVPPVAASLTFKLIFDRDTGAANALLEAVGVKPVTWLTDPFARYVLVMLVLWGCGNCMIISLAGLQDVPRELHEAAMVDGASTWQSFRRITVPIISPVLFFQVVTGIIAALQTFLPPVLLAPTAGATSDVKALPQGNTLYMVHVYAQYFNSARFGYASALLWVLFVIILIVTALIFKVGARTVFYGVDPKEGDR
ncbi:carbohydrate ABC transporter permease [Phytohabitans rumicis]|uniref:Sugar ABC transporter permease n=1 Tax=Phytohabitans rumicis TaxID=1076125 RepID=A0A6V8KYI7_9ACTN|nr:sugar ABC transporter permease [Phytohabitans rumicis]GFJ87748.1 sugar ABC transporter permease [Phytohabitans rumicis]